MVNTIYDDCYIVLVSVIEQLKISLGNDYSEIGDGLIKFLTTEDDVYDNVFNQFSYLLNPDKKKYYKKIMMLIIASNAYSLSLYFYNHDIFLEDCKLTIEELESVNYHQIIEKFIKWKDNLDVFSYIYDFLQFYNKNYILENNCMEEIIKNKKQRYLLKINPFEIYNYICYIDPKNLLNSEKIIENFIDIYYSSLYHAMYELEYDNIECLVTFFQSKVEENFVTQEEIQKFYSYIFSNIYETIVCKVDIELIEQYKDFISQFMSFELNYIKIYENFMFDIEFANNLINFFIDSNSEISKYDLLHRRETFKLYGNIDILREMNPFYDDEENKFIQEKRKIFPY